MVRRPEATNLRMRRSIPSLLPLLCLAVACDNAGSIWDPDKGGGGGGSEDQTNVQVVQAGGETKEGRPTVKKVLPTGAGWPTSTPIVVVFSEAMNEDSVAPPGGSGRQPNVVVRLKGSENALPMNYDFLLGGRVVLMRPVAPLTAQDPSTTYEVVVNPDARDVDGTRYGGPEPDIVAEFQPNEDSGIVDGKILTTLPEDHKTDQQRENPIYVVFTKPAVASTINATGLRVQQAGAGTIAGTLTTPLTTGQTPDTRIVRFSPTGDLPGDATIEIVVTADIKFGTTGKLDFGGRTPYAEFGTLPFLAPSSVTVGNATSGFPDKVNRNNLETLAIDVTVPATALAGDDVVVRVYGLDPKTKNTDDLNFVERSIRLVGDGAQTVAVSFAGDLGTLASPRFSDGAMTLAAKLVRGSRQGGFERGNANNAPRIDVTPPQLVSLAPVVGTSPVDFVTDQEHATLTGTASEQLRFANLALGSATAALFASAGNGRFALQPVLLGRLAAAVPYSLTLTDTAGNLAAAAVTGTITQRGAVTGSVAGGVLTVEAYDEATLQALANVQVLIEPGLPSKPAVNRQSGLTGADGRVTFSGLTQPTYTITLLGGGYHLRTLLATPAAFASLGLRPLANATATLTGTALFTASPGMSALLGCNVIDDPLEEDIATTAAAPTAIPATAIRAGRPLVLTAFGGLFEPTTVTAYSFQACQMSGTNGVTPTPPPLGIAGGQSSNQSLTLATAAGTTINLAATYDVDFAAATGLDTANLIGRPTVRIAGSLKGFTGMTLFGVGFTTATTGANFTVNGSYGLGMALALAPYQPVLWVSAEARDTTGNLSRHRRLILDNTLGITYPTVPAPGIPTITSPSGPSTGSPAVTYADLLDASALLGGFGFTELTATDAAGRRWSVLRQDTDGAAGAVTVQLPDLAGLPGLATGNWSVRAENHLIFSLTFAAGDYVVEEIRRQQVTYARAAAKSFTVN